MKMRLKGLEALHEAGVADSTVVYSAQIDVLDAELEVAATKAERIEILKSREINLNVSQLAPVGAGITEPVISKPNSIEEARQNMRVEFQIVKVDPEALSVSDFDF